MLAQFETVMLQAPGGAGGFQLIFLVGMISVMYFFMIRPQAKRAKEQKKFASSIGSGEKIVTTAGIHGTVKRVNEDGTLKNGTIFYDFSFTEDEEALDGMKVDKEGNLFVSAPGGVWILNANGKLLGKIVTPERPANKAWGDEDGKTLYLTAHTSLYKIRINAGGKISWE